MDKLEIIGKWDLLGKSFAIYGTLDRPLFLAKEVATLIEYTPGSINKMLLSADDSEKVRKIVPTPGGPQECWFLTENGLYEVLMQSRKPIAKEFKKRVKEILQTIRKTGAYSLPKQQSLEPLYTPAVRTYQGQRVVTVKDISLATKQPEGSIAYWLNSKCRKTADFILLRGAALQTFKIENGLQGYLASRLYVVLESGFRKLCKMLGIIPEKTGCFPIPKAALPPKEAILQSKKLRVDVPDNVDIQKTLQTLKKQMAALDVMLDMYDGYNTTDYQEAIKRFIKEMGFVVMNGVYEILKKPYNVIERTI